MNLPDEQTNPLPQATDKEFKPWLADLLDSIPDAPTGATLRGRMTKLADQIKGQTAPSSPDLPEG